MFNADDLVQITAKGMLPETVEKQVLHFISGFPFVKLARPAVAGDGIHRFSDDDLQLYREFFRNNLSRVRALKFVPASGAASRMFKHLFEFREKYSPGPEGEALLQSSTGFNSVGYLFDHLDKAAFKHDLAMAAAASGHDLGKLLTDKEFNIVVDLLLSPAGLNYASLPKGLLKFHDYPEGARTAAEEHLVEAAAYTRDTHGRARIHFTISPEHRERFITLFDGVQSRYERVTGVSFEISFSIQKPSTDMIAVDSENQPFRNPDGSLHFRPGGHGALLENLNDLDADLVFIKNIDNIVPDHLKPETYRYKEVIGGYLLFLREQVNSCLLQLRDHLSGTGAANLAEIADFAWNHLSLDLPPDLGDYSPGLQAELLFEILNRPLRVCGMVRNEGEPGGGPFWVTGTDGKVSLQIVESSQIDLGDPGQKAIFDQSTHFNPVDLACSIRDFEGNAFDLRKFIDEETGFISLKSAGGRTLKAQELPGLWNGSMARWITLFVEVPIITFNPVKTVNDLLRKEHLPS